MMKVLFIGGTGLISTAVSRQAIADGIDLYLLNRGGRVHSDLNAATLIRADINQEEDVAAALEGMRFDAVVDWIAFTPDAVERDLRLFRGRTGQYIFISSASVYQKPASHYLTTESTPLGNPYWPYAQNKIACEERLIEAWRQEGFPVTIVRPTLTYGESMIFAPMSSWQHPWSLIDRMRRGEKIIVPGDGSSLWVSTHNSDLARGLVGLLGNPQTLGHAFHITSDEALTVNQMFEIIARAAGATPNLIHIASDFIIACEPALHGDLMGDKIHSTVFDNSKIKRFVPDYVAKVPLHRGIERSMAWFAAHPEACTVDEQWNAMCDRIIAAYEVGLAAIGTHGRS